MSTEVLEQKDEVSFLDMSDEEIANIDPSTLNQEVSNDVTTDEDVQNGSNAEEGTEQGQSTDANAEEEGLLEQEDSDESSSEEEGDVSKSVAEEESTAKDPKTDPDSKDKEVEAKNAKAELDRLFTPFKANGREIAVTSVDDAIALMQMGANYNKKMAALKPNLKLMKMLENNGLLTEEKIGYLIDLGKQNPGAINKLVKDSGIDPLDISADKESDYKPTSYAVDDREMELDSVLDELQGSPTYQQTLDIVSNKWDGPSKQVIANQPQLLKVINSHVQSGIYDLINKEIESERVFGRLNGLSDIEAYRQVGDAINARGGFNHLENQGQQTQPAPVVVEPKPKKVDSDKIREKKRAASSTQPASAPQVSNDFNPLSLSDDAFSKLVNDKFL